MQGGFLASLLLLALCLHISSAGKIGDTCDANKACDAGLYCQTCLSATRARPRCTRIKPIDPKAKGTHLPFNQYSWLTTHNSFAQLGKRSATGSLIFSSTNQEDSVAQQLSNGVRGLMLDMYDFQNDIWLCHSFGGNCYNITAFQPAINVFKEIQAFLEANPSEIITIFIEDYVTSARGITTVLDAAGLMKYWFPLSLMPKNGGDWPILGDMISNNHRLVVFTSKSSKEASEEIAYVWNYVVENQYGDDGMKVGLCSNRPQSDALNTKSKSLILMNFFSTTGSITDACKNNSDPLIDMLETCRNSSANRWPNFIAVDFYKRSDRHGAAGAAVATEIANGQLMCGCGHTAHCKENATFDSCHDPEAEDATPRIAYSAPVQKQSKASRVGGVPVWFSGMVSMVMFFSGL